MKDEAGGALRRRTRDFPYYRGEPVAISPAGWSVVLLLTALGFVCLTQPMPPPWSGDLARYGGIALFVILPLAGLALTARRHWAAMFHAPTLGDIGIGLGFALVCVIVSGLVGWAVSGMMDVAANPAVSTVTHATTADRVVMFASMVPQLVGEELITLVPFLAVLTLCVSGLRLPRLASVLIAWIVSSLIFAALHLPTYDWHVAQTLAIIGVARLVLTLPFLITKNLWASAIAHIANDWILFSTALVLTSAAAG